MISKKNFEPTCPTFQGHWNWHGSIGYLWLPISDPYLS